VPATIGFGDESGSVDIVQLAGRILVGNRSQHVGRNDLVCKIDGGRRRNRLTRFATRNRIATDIEFAFVSHRAATYS